MAQRREKRGWKFLNNNAAQVREHVGRALEMEPTAVLLDQLALDLAVADHAEGVAPGVCVAVADNKVPVWKRLEQRVDLGLGQCFVVPRLKLVVGGAKVALRWGLRLQAWIGRSIGLQAPISTR